MDLSLWVCGQCRCGGIAGDLVACPQCSAPRAPATDPGAEAAPQESAVAAKAPGKSKTTI